MVDALKSPAPASKDGMIVLHQLLHGYAEGHRLLSGSIEVPEDLSRVMLRLSDLSGSNVSIGFDEYITGYPLPSLDAYALAKSWYAPEMPRPGCVWTHTILIPFAAMRALATLDGLRSLFKRPGERVIRDTYAKPLVLEKAPEARLTQMPGSGVLEALLSAHYGKGNIPVLIAARTSTEFEDLLFALWSQKWPRLRMTFTFCTGALSARFFERRPFDIQCVPIQSTRSVSLDIIEAVAIEPIVANSKACEIAPWALEAAEDAVRADGSGFRKFIWAVADETGDRTDFASFTSIFDAVRRSVQLDEMVDLVIKYFPSAKEGIRLKSLLFGDRDDDASISLPIYDERDVLLTLGTASAFESFDCGTLRLRERSARLCIAASDSAISLVGELFRSTLNPLGEEILAALIASMEPEVARRITSRQPQFLPALFQANPSLATSPQLWTAGGDRRREQFEAVAVHQDLDPKLVGGIVRALLESGTEALIRRALDLWGKWAVFETLDWIDAHQGSLSYACREALRLHLPIVMDWADGKSFNSFGSLYAVARVVGPDALTVSKQDSGVWIRNFRRLQKDAKESEMNYVCAFLLALGLNNSRPSPMELLTESFERVHKAAETEHLSDDAWSVVEPFLPELSWLSNWDKCERLRRGLISAFIENAWPIAGLKERVIHNEELFKLLAKSARKVDGGEEFFRDSRFLS